MTSEIAFNMNGEPFDPPPASAAWRVRKLKPKGAPEVVYGRDGLPLFLPLDADIEDLRREVPAPSDGRYRLDPVDEHNRPVPGAQSSYVCVHVVERAPEPTAPAAPAAGGQADTTVQLVNALLESQKRTVELAEVYVSQFPVIVNAMSGVIRAAGDAGLPTKVPLLVPVAPEAKPADPASDAQGKDDDEDDEDEDEDDEGEESEIDIVEAAPESANDWAKLGMAAFKRLEPYIDPLVGALTGKLAKGANGRSTAGAAPVTDLNAHLRTILAQLSPEEAAQAMQLARELPVTEQLAQAQRLGTMSVPEGVAFVRAELARRGSARSEREMSAAEIDAHIAAIRARLTPDDSKSMELMVEELPFELRRQYLENLASMSVTEALAKVRRELAGLNREFTAAHGAAEPRNARAPRASAAPVSAAKATSPSAKTAPQAASPAPEPARRLRIVRAPLEASRPSAAEHAPAAPSVGTTAPGRELGALSTHAHIAAIQGALSADENAAARAHVAALTAAERDAWIATLLMLPVPEAVAMIRARLAAGAAPAGARGDKSPAVVRPSEAGSTVSEAAPRNLASLTSASHALATAGEAAPQPERRAASAPMAPVGSQSAEIAELVVPELVVPELVVSEPVAFEPVASELMASELVASGPVASEPVASGPVASGSVASGPVASGPVDTAAARVVTVGSPAVAPAISGAALASVAPAIRAAATAPAATPRETPVMLGDAALAHLEAIERALTDEERFLVHAMVALQPPEERNAWRDRLLAKSVAEGAQILRETIRDLMAEQGVAGEEPGGSVALQDGEHPDDGEVPDGGDDPDSGEQSDDGDDLDDAEPPYDGDDLDAEQPDEAHQVDDDQAARDREDGHGAVPARTLAPAGLPSVGLLTLDPETSAHLKAIEQSLTFTEQMRLMALAAQRPAAELRAWLADLARSSVPEALAKLRAALAAADAAASDGKRGGVS